MVKVEHGFFCTSCFEAQKLRVFKKYFFIEIHITEKMPTLQMCNLN